MRVVRIGSLVVMIAALVLAVFVIINNVVAPGNVPSPLEPFIEVLPEQGSTAAAVLSILVVAVAVLASTVHTKSKKALETEHEE